MEVNTRIIGYWCLRCEENGRQTFMFKKEGYCDCMGEMGIYEQEIGHDEDGGVYGFTSSDIKKCQKNWIAAFITQPTQ